MAGIPTTRNRRTFLVALAAAACMTGAAFAAPPLYRIFCQVTGYGGTTQVANAAPAQVLDRRITIRFNADVDPDLPWSFAPSQGDIDIRIGEQALAFYRARNLSKAAVAGTATFNVTPLKAGRYFNKIECFCFTEQRLEAGAAADMPVAFFIDPAIAKDPGLNDVTTITLSYTFFHSEEEEAGRDAAQAFADG